MRSSAILSERRAPGASRSAFADTPRADIRLSCPAAHAMRLRAIARLDSSGGSGGGFQQRPPPPCSARTLRPGSARSRTCTMACENHDEGNASARCRRRRQGDRTALAARRAQPERPPDNPRIALVCLFIEFVWTTNVQSASSARVPSGPLREISIRTAHLAAASIIKPMRTLPDTCSSPRKQRVSGRIVRVLAAFRGGRACVQAPWYADIRRTRELAHEVFQVLGVVKGRPRRSVRPILARTFCASSDGCDG